MPFVLLADKVLFAEVDEIGDWFSGEELKTVDDIYLGELGGEYEDVDVSAMKKVGGGGGSEESFIPKDLGRYPRLDERS